uniref:Alcohol dehydrogenase n=1 Tax=Stomoxys calcitrans TaxID=35570 RepID=A0A1I8NR43_STOCA
MNLALKCKNVIYLGGFGGIGQKCVEEFLKKGVKSLVVFDLKENSEVLKNWQQTYKSCDISFQPVDVTKSETIEEAYKKSMEKLEHIDVVLNGCGLMNDRYLDLTIDINLRGVLHSSMIALKYMDKSKGGRGGVIANISSVAGIEASGMFAIYSAAKHGVTAFSRAMSNPLYFNNTGVNFITICPGLTETSLLDNVKDKVTLVEFGKPMAERFVTLQTQPANVCAENIIKAIEADKLGAVWLLDRGEISEMEMPVMWKAQ